ncbi:RNA 2'-phosphotransferase [Brevibacillus sp. SAFN-007a]|uniref:RNA 2'-phosphotransferase n=1 Tax=Brevibacillus sp. SAFN-007a TaxID=3436862 RepID=UPI003F7EA62B
MLAQQAEITLRKRLLSILRQKNEHVQLYFDTYGFTPTGPLLASLRAITGWANLSRSDLWQVVEKDPERQIEWDGGEWIRATYGFAPTRTAARLTEAEPPERLYYGTHAKLVSQALSEGLLPIASELVQLAGKVEDIGLPEDTLALLTVQAARARDAGVRFFKGSGAFWFSEAIPAVFVAE